MDFLLDLNGFSNIAKQIVVPYKLIKEKEFVNYSIVYKQKDYFPSKYEQYEIIKAESNKELSFKYNFMDGKLKFNRISPGDITIKINTTTLNDIQKGDIYEKMFEKGMKRLLVSFVPTLYDNDNEIFELKRVIKKEVILDLKDEESIFLDIMLDATYEKEHIDLKITKNIYDEKFVIKPIMNEFIKKQRIDVYRD
jgi:predicted transcriptional regulator